MNKLMTTLATFGTTFLFAGTAYAQTGEAGVGNAALVALAAGITVGIAAVGVAFGQGRATSAALEGIGRNPNAAAKIQTPMILGLAFMEFLCILAFFIAFLLQGKV